MNLDERIQDIAESGLNSCKHKTYQLLSDAISAISHHTAIPVGELLAFVKDELK